ncbi:hypothetical protein CRUP_036809 [Coryphaenoides rupestris]|nr:hypothetical protein CRUP_036809 [Coryphaenoides rupestris]
MLIVVMVRAFPLLKKAVTDLSATPLPRCSAGSTLLSQRQKASSEITSSSYRQSKNILRSSLSSCRLNSSGASVLLGLAASGLQPSDLGGALGASPRAELGLGQQALLKQPEEQLTHVLAAHRAALQRGLHPHAHKHLQLGGLPQLLHALQRLLGDGRRTTELFDDGL